jgi:para-nitrobenzyl esterase
MQSVLSSGARPRSWRKCFLISTLLAATALTAGPVLAHDSDDDNSGPVVNTAEGPVRGLSKNGVSMFLGIPYAAPPVGKLRWQPPQPVKKWRDTYDATDYKSTCPQVTELGAFAGPASVNEDCLYLSVFTSNKKNGKKPVLVWIHGGGNVDGESNDYDASKLATGGPNGKDTVVVVINYRLGLFGFLSQAALNNEGHLWGNYGILDIQAVLRWVQRNAAAFGGDPTKVALGGQSAGAQDTGANVLSPLAAGLFNRAIYESAPLASLQNATNALNNGNNFATAAGCTGSNVAQCLRNLSTSRILQLQGTPNANGPYITGPFVDGTIIPLQPEAAWTTGRFNKMPTMGGAVHDEGNFSIGITEYFSGPPQVPMTVDQYNARVTGATAAQYPLSDYGGNTQLAFDRVSTDRGKCSGLHVLKEWGPQVPTYAYDFTYLNAPYYFPKMPGFQALAAHTIDIQFLFSNWHGGPLGVNLDQTTGVPREIQGAEIGLSDSLVAAWTNFAATGNPNGSGSSPWPKVAGSSVQFLSENTPLTTESEAAYRTAYKCDFWDTQITYPLM